MMMIISGPTGRANVPQSTGGVAALSGCLSVGGVGSLQYCSIRDVTIPERYGKALACSGDLHGWPGMSSASYGSDSPLYLGRMGMVQLVVVAGWEWWEGSGGNLCSITLNFYAAVGMFYISTKSWNYEHSYICFNLICQIAIKIFDIYSLLFPSYFRLQERNGTKMVLLFIFSFSIFHKHILHILT